MASRSPPSPRHRSPEQRNDRQPETVDRLHHDDELLEIDGFRHVAVGVQLVAPQHVLVSFGRSQHDDRNVLQLAVVLDDREHFTPVDLGEIEIEQDDVGSRRILV